MALRWLDDHLEEWLRSIGHDPETYPRHSCNTCRSLDAAEDAAVAALFMEDSPPE